MTMKKMQLTKRYWGIMFNDTIKHPNKYESHYAAKVAGRRIMAEKGYTSFKTFLLAVED